ncbi:hypothetical protein CKAH01_06464 [Colletotrichum kahawae]|uniref:Uncharacterized protein n=1 Tax=Colletotrichum kahawae TaxID=34407 RepID=A0AAE0D2V9_COLKA|nr:hypothetical protein CKAH01_06464 [Colletotrichum kahawae]
MQQQPLLYHHGSSPRRRPPRVLATQRPSVSPNFASPNQNHESSASKPHRRCHRPRGGHIGAESSLQPRPNRDPTAPNSAPLFLADRPRIAATPLTHPRLQTGKGASAGRPPIVRHQQHHSASGLASPSPHLMARTCHLIDSAPSMRTGESVIVFSCSHSLCRSNTPSGRTQSDVTGAQRHPEIRKPTTP